MSNGIYKPSGFIRTAHIESIDPDLMIARIKFMDKVGPGDENGTIVAQLPASFYSVGGGFIGGWVAEGTPVAVMQAEGSGGYFILAFLAQDPSSRNPISASKNYQHWKKEKLQFSQAQMRL